MATERKKGAKGVARSELVAVRFDPKTKYLLDLAARVQRRSMANFIEWLVEESFKSISLYANPNEAVALTIADEAPMLWASLESERVLVLGMLHPQLLTFEEQQCLEALEVIYRPLGLSIKKPDLEAYKVAEENWIAIKRGVEEGMAGRQIGENICRPPETVASLTQEIRDREKDLNYLKQRKAELESVEKNG